MPHFGFSEIMDEVRKRIQENTGANLIKNAGEQVAREVAEKASAYVSKVVFVKQLVGSLQKIFGPVGLEWVSRGAGVLVATAIGTPQTLVNILAASDTPEARAQARHIIAETIDEAVKTFIIGLAGGLSEEQAAQNALDFNVLPKALEIKETLDQKVGIVHYGLVPKVHSLNCPKVYRNKKAMGFDPDRINGDDDTQKAADQNGQQQDATKGEPKPKESDLIPGAKIKTLKEMIEEGLDVEHPVCDCRGMVQDFKHLVEMPKSVDQIRVILRKSPVSADRLLEARLGRALKRLRDASATDVHPVERKELLERLTQPIWTVDGMRLHMEEWGPTDDMSTQDLLREGMKVFRVQDLKLNKFLHGTYEVVKAIVTGDDAEGKLDQTKAFFANVRADAKKGTDAAAKRRRARKMLGY